MVSRTGVANVSPCGPKSNTAPATTNPVAEGDGALLACCTVMPTSLESAPAGMSNRTCPLIAEICAPGTHDPDSAAFDAELDRQRALIDDSDVAAGIDTLGF